MFIMKKKLFLLISLLILVNGSLAAPVFAASTTSDPATLNCLCEAACAKAGWDCSVVGCAYDATPNEASPECLDTSKGGCICIGYGCGRAPVDYSTPAAAQCMANAEVTDCNTQFTT